MSRRLTPAQAAAALRAPRAAAPAVAARPEKKAATPQGGGEVRIIGGQWKRTRLPVAQLPGLRPTPDRVRETLFNSLHHEQYRAVLLHSSPHPKYFSFRQDLL